MSSDEKWYDFVTPYGYGGPLITEVEDGAKEQLVKAFYEEFSRYCAEQKIVSEFVRFHPIAQNALDFIEVYPKMSIHPKKMRCFLYFPH